ncbi:MAG TPA: hypothetical protein VE153_17815, partial [Myxococcus sp.]|nr:hypothetical protein [Myxococcus sp.]
QAAAKALRNFVQKTDSEATRSATTAAGQDAAQQAHPFGPLAETLRRAAAAGERELWALHTTLSASPEPPSPVRPPSARRPRYASWPRTRTASPSG